MSLNSLDNKETAVKRRRAKLAEIRQRYPGLHKTGEELCLVCNDKAKPVAWSTIAGGLICEETESNVAEYVKVPMSRLTYGEWLPPMETPFLDMVPRKIWDSPVFQWKPLIEPTPRTFKYPFGPMPPLQPSTALNLTEMLASGQAKRINDHTIEVVTPGYHSTQGATMSSVPRTCGIPGCTVCPPVTMSYDAARKIAEEAMRYYAILPSDLGLPKQKQGESMSSSKTQQALNAVRELENAELSTISTEIDAIQRRNKDRIIDGLGGVADLAVMSKPKLRRFVIAYYINGEAKSAEGVEFGDTSFICDDKVCDEARVWVSDNDYPVKGMHYTMGRLRKRLEESGVPFVIKYFA